MSMSAISQNKGGDKTREKLKTHVLVKGRGKNRVVKVDITQCIGTTDKKVETFLSTIKKFKSDYMIRGFVVKVIYAD